MAADDVRQEAKPPPDDLTFTNWILSQHKTNIRVADVA